MTVTGRFAPSPSGRMHLGNVFCALLAWLSARAQGGAVVLRIEDLDPARCRPAYAAQLEDDLRWLGLDWDEGGAAGGAAYFQSSRTAPYAEAFERLRSLGLVYPCFCTRAELHAASAPHLSDGRAAYPGTCRGLSAEEAARRAQSRAPAWRIQAPDRVIGFTDGLQGAYAENPARTTGDFILRRSDGVYAYQLAVVVDDAAHGVTEVVRGRDLLDSTPRQLYLYGLLGLRPPAFTHIPLLLAPDGRRLSKRDGDLDLGALRKAYRSPEPLLGQLAYLAGLLPAPTPVTASELIPHYNVSLLPAADIRLSDAFYRVLARGGRA